MTTPTHPQCSTHPFTDTIMVTIPGSSHGYPGDRFVIVARTADGEIPLGPGQVFVDAATGDITVRLPSMMSGTISIFPIAWRPTCARRNPSSR